MKFPKRLSAILLPLLCFASGILHAQQLPPAWMFPPAWESWSFFDSTNWSSDNGFPALSFTNIAGVQRGDVSTEYAVVVDATNVIPARLQYNVVETNGATNLTIGVGAVTFWVTPDGWASASTNGTGPSVWAELFSVGQWTTNASYGYWGLSLDAGGTNIYFAAQNSTGSNAVYLSAPIAWNTNEWHFVALSYSATNTALYLDGLLATNGSGLTVLPSANVITNGFFIGSDSTGFEQSRCMFDDVYTFPNPITADDAENIYDNQFFDFYLSPYNNLDQPYNNPDPFFTNTSSLMVNIASISNNLAGLLMMNTTPDVLYEIQGITNLSQTNWISEGFVYGSELTNWTPATISGLLPGNLFLRTRSWQDSTGSGVPDWWWLKYFNVTNVDPWTYDSSGDGYTYLDDYLNGFAPGQWNTPGAPTGLTVQYHATAKTATISWQPSPGPVQSYTVEKVTYGSGTTDLNFPAGTTSFTDSVPYPPNDISWSGPEVAVFYSMQAHYAGGDSSWSAQVPLESAYGADIWSFQSGISAQLAVGQQNVVYLTMSTLPPNAATIQITRVDVYAESDYGDSSFDLSQDFPISVLTNGVFQLPVVLMSSPVDSYGNNTYEWWLETLDANGNPGAPVSLGEGGVTSSATGLEPLYFFDGRQQLVQNLDFLLRVPTVAPFNFVTREGVSQYGRTLYPPNYVYAGLYQPLINQSLDTGVFDPYQPYKENYTFHNFVFTPSDLNTNGELVTGVQDLYYPMDYQPYDTNSYDSVETPDTSLDLEYVFQTPTNAAPVPPILDPTSDAKWTYFLPLDTGYYLDAINVTPASGQYYMTNNGVNYFGLPYVSALFAYNAGSSPQLSLLSSNSSIPAVSGFVYPQAAMPQLQTVGYYFAEPNANSDPQQPVNVIPGNAAFSPTNITQLLCAGFGQPVQIAGYAKQQLLNGYSGVYGFLGQYFEYSYTMGTNGQPTTNSAGIISPYGIFLPTNDGPVVLVTMTNWGDYTGQRGTAVVQVVSLNLDANHDGTMDFSFGGSDQTSLANPYRFWVNDNSDLGDDTGDGIPGKGAEADGLMQVQVPYNGPYDPYIPNPVSTGAWMVHGRRDLVDFFPVCVNIRSLFQSNMLSAGISPTDTNYQFILSQADGALRFAYTDLTPTNYMNFLLDTNESGLLAYASLTNITSDGVILSSQFLSGVAASNQNIILVEGWTNTTAPLVLSIYQNGTNLLVQTSLYPSLSGVEDMFRHKNLISEVFPNSNSAQGKPDRLTDGSVPNEPPTNNKNFVFLHGYNVDPDQARGNASDIFKKLYWSGSHAKFWAVTWHGSESQVFGSLTTDYHTNVVNAFLTAPHLANFLATLTGSTTVAAHSLGNMVALSAINDWNAHPDNYFMVDAAVATEAIDGSTPPVFQMTYSTWISPENYSTRLYADCWANLFPSSDARSALTWSNRLANLGNVTVYNFYSSGEEVLREYNDDPPLSAFGSASLLRTYWDTHQPVSSFAWVWQEKGKGVGPVDNVLGSTHGGWKLNTSYNTNDNPMSAAQANVLPASELQTNGFFDVTSLLFGDVDLNLYGPSGSSYAAANGNRILADAIPALSWPIGSHQVPALDEPNEPHNFDMMAFENGWPQDRSGEETGRWHHSDFRAVAYTFTFPVFDEWVALGNLK